MENSQPKRKHTLRNVILGVVALPVLFVVYVIGSILLSPVFQHFEKARFEKLDEQSRVIFNRVKERSGGVEDWSYKTSCSVDRSGWLATNKYSCRITILTESNITYVDQLNNLQDKYYPVIDSSYTLKKKTDLDKEYPGQFGVKFVVSSAEKDYVNTDGIECTYLAKLNQANSDSNFKYGADIAGGIGKVTISFDCGGLSSGDWYK